MQEKEGRHHIGTKRGCGKEEKISRKKFNRGQKDCDREKTNPLKRGAGRLQLCGVRNEKGVKTGRETSENNKPRAQSGK